MTFFQPTEAPAVHFEPLPSNTIALQVEQRAYVGGSYRSAPKQEGALWVTVWAPRQSPMTCIEGGDLDNFYETVCYDCQYYVENMEWESYDLDYPRLNTPEGELEVTGTITFESPCSCYNNGIGEVEFPCYAGHEEPEPMDSDVELSCAYMRYTVVRNSVTSALITDEAAQQAIVNHDGRLYVTEKRRAINTFDHGTYDICWGENNNGTDLLKIEMIFTSSPANEDLLSFEAHADNEADCKTEAETELYDGYLQPLTGAVSVAYDGRPMGVVSVTAHEDPQTFVLLASSGAEVNGTVAYLPITMYRNVAVSDDFVSNIWSSEVMPTGARLLFLASDNELKLQYLGQVPNTFNLQECKSIKQSSSDVAEPVSN